MSRNKNASPNTLVGIYSSAYLVVNFYFNLMPVNFVIISIVMLLMLTELFRNHGSAIINSAVTLLGIFYIGLFSSAIIAIREFYKQWNYSYGGMLIIALMITIWACDSAAFFIGSAIGKHKLFPRVSPNKSWEGAIAGFIFSVAAMVICKKLFLGFLSVENAAAIGIITGSVGQAGDLIESLIKRDAKVKDSSNLIPGHGGVFDRFDSLFLTAPAVYLYLTIFVKQ
jgi:phosphatidate cytidylyltransferase